MVWVGLYERWFVGDPISALGAPDCLEPYWEPEAGQCLGAGESKDQSKVAFGSQTETRPKEGRDMPGTQKPGSVHWA